MVILDANINSCEDPAKCWEIKPIRLATVNTTVTRSSVLRAIGWGADKTGKQSRYMKQVNLRFHSAPVCKCPSYYELFTMVGVDGQDTCKGDSGEIKNMKDFTEGL